MFRPLAAVALTATLVMGTMATADARVTLKRDSVFTDQRYTSVTLIDSSPATGKAFIWIKKKSGPTACVVKRIAFTRGGKVTVFGPFRRSGSTARKGIGDLYGRRDRTIGVRITTNGRCYVGVATL